MFTYLAATSSSAACIRTRASREHKVAARRIGILTGGGDVPGLNSVIKSVVYNATEIGCEVIGIRRGWEGLTHMKRAETLSPTRPTDADYIRQLDRGNTRTIDRTGGTVLHTSRTNPSKMRAKRLPAHLTPDEAARYQVDDDVYDLTPLVMNNIDYLGLDYLITIGGDDTLSYSKVLDRLGVPLIAIPKTMDNDVHGTEYCIGFSIGRHAGEGADQPPAHVAGLARADRRVPHLRPREWLHGAVRGVRHLGPLRDPRGALRPRPSHRGAARGQAAQPVALRVRDRLGRCDVGGRDARGIR